MMRFFDISKHNEEPLLLALPSPSERFPCSAQAESLESSVSCLRPQLTPEADFLLKCLPVGLVSSRSSRHWRPGGERPLLSGSRLQQHPIASASRPGLEPQLRGARAGGGCISRGTVAVPASCNCVRSECWCSPHSSRGNPTPAGDGIRRLRGPGGVCHEDVTQEEMPCEEIPGPCSAGRAEASAAWKRPVT